MVSVSKAAKHTTHDRKRGHYWPQRSNTRAKKNIRGNSVYRRSRHTEGATKFRSMFHPVNSPVQWIKDKQHVGRDSQDRKNTARILCLRFGASLNSLGRLNPLHRSCITVNNFRFTFCANDLGPPTLCVRSRTVCSVIMTGCCDPELEVLRPCSMSCFMKKGRFERGDKETRRREWVRVLQCYGVVPLNVKTLKKIVWGGWKAAKVTRTSMITLFPEILAVRWAVATCKICEMWLEAIETGTV